MESIHLKTVDPVSQELLRSAARRGINLNWERYERLQPQDGFLRLGLSCPFGCMQGPCRIDPFERGPVRGHCGLGRDGMVAAMLLRICLQGAMEVVDEIEASDDDPGLSFPASLQGMAQKAMKKFSVDTISTDEIFKSAMMLQRPATLPGRILEQALRTSLLAVARLGAVDAGKKKKVQTLQAGYGVLCSNNIHIAVVGNPSQDLLAALAAAAADNDSPSVGLVSMGEWIQLENGFIPIACSSGEAELVLSSNVISAVVAGSGADPAIIELCRQMEVPLATSDQAIGAKEIITLAKQFNSTSPPPEIQFDPRMRGEGEVITDVKDLQKRIKNISDCRFALLGGRDTLQHPLGYLPVELAGALRGEGYQICSWGDAAVWMIKDGLAVKGNDLPVHVVESRHAPLAALDGIAAAGKLDKLRGICFTGVRDCRDLSVAMGLAALGFNVMLANPIPIWGSNTVRNHLAEMLASVGGQLNSFDHPVEAQEILDWFAA